MTTPAGVPNLPIGALTVATLAEQLQDQTAAAMKARAGERVPTVFNSSTGGDILNDLSPFGIITNIWAGINSLIATSDPSDIQGPEDIPPLLLDFIEGLPFVGQFVTLLEALIGTYDGTDETLLSIQELLSPIVEFFSGLIDEFGTLADWVLTFDLSAALQDVQTFFEGLADRTGFLSVFEDVIAFFTTIADFSTWTGVLEDVISFFANIADFSTWTGLLEDIVGFFGDLVGSLGSGLFGVLTTAFDFLHWLFGTAFADAVDTLKNIFTTLSDLTDDAGNLATWVGQIPIIGPLVSALTGKTQLDGVALDLSTLGSWANGVLTQVSDIPANNLKGLLPSGILSSIPLSNINFETPNLLSQGDFGSAGTIEANDGWVWDSSQNHSGSGGCAKVSCNGTARRLYSSQVIKVVAGDRINLSAYIKTSSDFSGGSSSIELSLVPFVGTSRYTVSGSPVNVIFNSRGSTSNAWAGPVTGSTSNATSPWTVPSGITSVRVRLAVTAAATAGSVWFDDIDLHKTGLLSGDWMQGIMGTVAADFQAIVDKVIQAIKGTVIGGTGNPLTAILTSLQSIFNTLFNIPQLPTSLVSNPLLEIAVPGLQASKITSGSFGTDRIADDAVTTAKIGPSAVTSGEIAADAVGTYQIADDAVGTAQIATDAVTTNEIAPLAVTSAEIKDDAVTNAKIATNAVTANEIANSTITTTQFASTTIPAIGTALGTAITTGSGGKQSRTNTATKVTAGAGDNKFSAFFVNPSGSIVEQRSADISIPVNGRFTVTHAGYYIVELGFTVNASTPATGFFNVAPAIFLNGAVTAGGIPIPLKVGADSLGSFGFGAGNYSRSAHSTFIVYMGAGHYIEAGYRNFGASNANFFQGDANGDTTFFSIAMLNRTAEG